MNATHDVSDELDEVVLTRKFSRFVEESELSLSKIAGEMGVLVNPQYVDCRND